MLLFSILFLATSGAQASTLVKRTHHQTTAPAVFLAQGAFSGTVAGDVMTYLGIPYAAAPVGNLRFEPPQSPKRFSGIRQAIAFGNMCPQSNSTDTSLALGEEDCLFLNIVKPSSIPFGKRLPVIFWVNGGQFATGDTSQNPGNTIVERSLDLGEPVVYVSANYRLNGFGFLGGKQMQEAGLGNLGLRDQRFAMQWVHNNIAAFGGDPNRVIISGESAGAISMGLQLIAYNGNTQGLYHGAFLSSGAPYNLHNMTNGQVYFDSIANSTNCASASNVISCLKGLSFTSLQSAVINVINQTWVPYTDYQLFNQNPLQSVFESRFAHVPVVTGNVDDEGTNTAITELKITNDKQFQAFTFNHYLIGATPAQQQALLIQYPNDTTQGSPYDTGTANAVTPEYKRTAAFEGDITFQMPRRTFAQYASKRQPFWSFLYKRGKSTPELGSYHTLDIADIYGTNTVNDYVIMDAFINFANTLNPTEPRNHKSYLTSSGIQWSQYNTNPSAPPMLTLVDGTPNLTITTDTYRIEPIATMLNVTASLMTDT